jgi:hypothetical protein
VASEAVSLRKPTPLTTPETQEVLRVALATMVSMPFHLPPVRYSVVFVSPSERSTPLCIAR